MAVDVTEGVMAPAASAPPARRRGQRLAIETLIYLALFGFMVWALFPVLWGLVTSLKVDARVMTFPPEWIPDPLTSIQYQRVFRSRMPRFFVNSAAVGAMAVGLTLLVAAPASYSFARFDFRGKTLLLFTILGTMMVARLANIVPLFLLGARFDLLDTRWILVLVYSGWQIPLIVWLLKDFFERVPPNLDKAALVDGYGRLKTFLKISLPLARPGLAASALLVFVYVWNDFIIALTLTTSQDVRMVTVGLYNYVEQFGIRWGELMAAVMLALLPVVVLFLMLQRLFVGGITSGALKG